MANQSQNPDSDELSKLLKMNVLQNRRVIMLQLNEFQDELKDVIGRPPRDIAQSRDITGDSGNAIER